MSATQLEIFVADFTYHQSSKGLGAARVHLVGNSAFGAGQDRVGYKKLSILSNWRQNTRYIGMNITTYSRCKCGCRASCWDTAQQQRAGRSPAQPKCCDAWLQMSELTNWTKCRLIPGAITELRDLDRTDKQAR